MTPIDLARAAGRYWRRVRDAHRAHVAAAAVLFCAAAVVCGRALALHDPRAAGLAVVADVVLLRGGLDSWRKHVSAGQGGVA